MELGATRILGLDIGEKRIGVAISDPEGILASPLTIISFDEPKDALAAVAGIIAEKQPERIVAGLPRSLNGRLGPQAQKVQAFIEQLSGRISIPVELRDERFTSVLARRLMQQAGKKGRAPDDAVAAAVILQDYLDEKRPVAGPEDNV